MRDRRRQVAYQLNFDGVDDFLLLPSLTFHAIHVWMRVDSWQPNPGARFLLDAREDHLTGPFLSSAYAPPPCRFAPLAVQS